jgi:EmrB/QacA subfamily drug resistance transporter
MYELEEDCMTATRSAVEEPVRAEQRRRWLVLALLAGAQLMLVLDVTVVNVALPDIGAALDLGRATVPWVLTTYTLAFGGLMLLGGRVADLVGARRVMLSGLAVFTAASLLCGLANGPVELLLGRGVQGLAAAFLSPAALSLVMVAFPGPDRPKALAIWSLLAGVGSALGVILGGVLTSAISWRWIFTINVPIGAALLLALPRLTAAGRAQPTERTRLDVLGAALVTAGTGAAIYGLVNAGNHGWAAPSTVLALVLAAALWTAFAMVERSVAQPLLAVTLFGRRPVLGGAFLMVVATGLLVGGFFLGSFELQRVEHYSAVHVGVVFLPIAVATALGAQAAGHAVAHLDTRAVAVTGLALATAGYAAAMEWTQPVGVVAGLSVAALGIGATFVTAFTSSLADATPDESGLRSAIVGTFHELGGALGVAVLSTAAGAALTATSVTADDFSHAFTVGAISAGVGVLLAALLVPAVKRHGGAGGHGH